MTILTISFILSLPGKKAKGVRFQGDFQDSLPRSRSYSGNHNSKRSSSAGSGSAGRPKSNRRHRRGSSENRVSRHSHHHHNHQSSSASAAKEEGGSHSRHHHHHSHRSAEKNFSMVEGDSDSNSICSTCSSSSSSGDELYELPQRRHYGGVRVSYVPNDALAIARKQQQQRGGFGGAVGQARSVNTSAGTPSGLDDNKDKNCIIS